MPTNFEKTFDLITLLSGVSGPGIFTSIKEKIKPTVGTPAQPTGGEKKEHGYSVVGEKKTITGNTLDTYFLSDKSILSMVERIQGKKDKIIQYGRDCYPIIDEKLINLIKEFISHKKQYGTEVEQKLYNDYPEDDVMVSKFINRILFQMIYSKIYRY